MNQLKKLFLGLALMAGVFASGGASAGVICSGCEITGAPASFLGALNPITFDQSSFTHTAIANGAFSDWWVFTINPAGLASIGAVFTPSFGVSGFNVDLFALSASVCAPLVGGPPANNSSACASFTTAGAAIATSAGGFALNIPPTGLLGGQYAFHITGNSLASGFSNLYSGNVTTQTTVIRVPEPASLALLALGLLAAGATLRRRS